MKFHTKIIPIFLLFRLTSAIDFDEGCMWDGGGGGGGAKNTSLKLVFVVDQTHSFNVARRVFANAIVPLALALKAFYRRTEFALTLFADWPASAGPDVGTILEELGQRPHENAEGCYARRQSLDESATKVSNLLRDQRPIPNGGRENSLAAMAMSVVDRRMGWDANTNNQRVRKVAMVLTERSYGNISKPGSRTDFKGDGSDLCKSSKPPTVSQVGDILAKNNVAVIAIIPPSQYEQNALQWYQDHIGQLPTVPFCGREFNLIQGFQISTLVDFVKGCLLGFEDGDGGGGGGGGKPGEPKPCLFGDPEGFNTLGF